MRPRIIGTLLAVLLLAVGLTLGVAGHGAHAASSPPATTLGFWDGTPNQVVDSQHPDVENIYEYWSSSFPTSFADNAESAGATPYVELEPWQGVTQGNSGDCSYSSNFPSMTTIAANGSAISSYLKGLGSSVASFGHPVIFTFAHEFNVSGQYPWAQGDCEGTTAAQWVQAWDTVRNDVDSTANGLAYFMWVPDVFNGAGGTVVDPTPYWPGASNVDMVGVDGYPQSQYGETTYANTFADSFNIIKGLSGESTIPQPKIFVAETDFQPLDTSPYESISNMVSDICSNGGDGVLQYQDGAPALSTAQWSELDTALANHCSSGTGSTPTPTPTPTKTGSPTPTPTPTPTKTGSPTPTPTPTPTGGTWSCTTSADNGVCPSGGNYNGSLTGAAHQVTEDVQNVSNPSSAFKSQTLQANSASKWQVTANIAAGNTAFISYPNVQDTLTNTSGQPVPLADYSSLTSSYATTLPSASSSDDWAAGYAIWLGDSSTNFAQEVIVWTANHGQVPSGSDIQTYTDPTSRAVYELWENWNTGVVTLVPKVNSTSGSFNIYDLAEYLTQNGFADYATGITQLQYGFVLASTSGANETFAVSNFTLAGTGDGKNGAPGA